MKKILVTPEGTFELELTADEVLQRQIDEEKTAQENLQAEQEKLARLAKEEQEKARKESAIAKLKALGLTEEEVKSIL
jgi:molecular chaperone GrpE (heat shock protein)